MDKARFKAGRYYVGDPCYVLADDVYDEALGHHHDSDEQATVIDVRENRVWFADCVEGESEYTDDYHTYVNDTTLLSLVPEALVKPEGPDDDGPIQEFPNDFEVERDGSGVLFIGHLTIDTARPIYEDEEDYLDDYGEEDEEDEDDYWG